MRVLALVLSIILTLQFADAQQQNRPAVRDFPRFRLVQGRVDSDGLPVSGAKLCLLQPANVCYTTPESPTNRYEFGLEPLSERLPLMNGGSVVFFSSRFSGGGSGTLDSLAVLRFNDGGLINLLPYTSLSNVSDRAAWSMPGLSSYPIIVTADFVWLMDKGEVHFGDHFYVIDAFRYDPLADRYARVLEYRTARKYSGGDSEPIRVLKPERVEIERRLRLASSK